jgi:hypothetical protein
LDQFSYLRLVVSLGCGVGGVRLNKLTAKRLAAHIAEAASKAERAKEVGKKIRLEDGVSMCTAIIESFIKEKVTTGKWKDDFITKFVRRVPRPTPLVEGRFALHSKVKGGQRNPNKETH